MDSWVFSGGVSDRTYKCCGWGEWDSSTTVPCNRVETDHVPVKI
ncbi:hypothetical protein C4K04_6035 [Pseudomonas chlororaphis]|uniref:Uncharacterized protein n=1 Tax=Pseudomonas chlororaphis TaxID=587753 RepID=A0A3G7TX26_9PSED|nr:hypothetical protein C4K20_5905 [Pseudomonas chlororaphis subsp. aurantiaca]AZD69917.1 hypothetical protein C4K17_6076 [Pseudomonas chlororaphis subsp. aurantiaca]AZD82366.1 hypothetical protein C4K15_5844 [Pseudomonas chlororaphis subsp. aurantiaca]AZE51663.1 hypothetical protein C4K04_6035 [Pseudomonas chlororaphis]